jgi:hypothetical protein
VRLAETDGLTSLRGGHLHQHPRGIGAHLMPALNRVIHAVRDVAFFKVPIIDNDVQAAATASVWRLADRMEQAQDIRHIGSGRWLVRNRSAHGVKCSLAPTLLQRTRLAMTGVGDLGRYVACFHAAESESILA